MRNIRRSVALALAAIMMMAMNMVSFAADTALLKRGGRIGDSFN